MKSQLIRVATLSALVLASSSLTFAGSQARVQKDSKDEVQDRSGIARAVQQGKGSGMTRNQAALGASAYREQTAQDSAKLRNESGDAGSNSSDTAFRK